MLYGSYSDAVPAQTWTRGEVAALLSILLLFLAVNCGTATRLPIVWSDEVFFLDPAVNLARGQGFVTTAWPQASDRFFACNVPLYSFLLSFWIRLFGVVPLAVRTFGYVWMGLASGILWVGLVRTRFVQSAAGRLMCVATPLLSYEVSRSYRSARYDSLGICLLCIVFLGYTFSTRAKRNTTAVIFGALLPLAGLQLVIFSVIFSGILLPLFPRARVYVIWSFIGIGLGAALLLGLYQIKGVLWLFVENLLNLSAGNQQQHISVVARITGKYRNVFYDAYARPTFLILLPYLGLLIVGAKPIQWRRPAVFGVIIGILLPLVMDGIYSFPIYYSWIVTIPMIVCAAAETANLKVPSLLRVVGWLALAAICVGLPLRILLIAPQWDSSDYSIVESFVNANVNSADHVVCDYSAYYPAKNKAKSTFVIPFLPYMREDERRGVNVMIIDPDPANFTATQSPIGGTWAAVASMSQPRKKLLLGFLRSRLDRVAYRLTVFRRVQELEGVH